MPEILTESFCERCGTRYTFESTAPKSGRLSRFKTISTGLKNYVLSDEASLDEALADARNDDDRRTSGEQLDAFHKTFNFCMSCRQYTCANCWNEPEGRCLTCAPHLGREILPAPFPTLEPTVGLIGAAPATNGNGHVTGNGTAGPVSIDSTSWPTVDLGDGASENGRPDYDIAADEAGEAPISRLEALFGAAPRVREPGEAEPAAVVDAGPVWETHHVPDAVDDEPVAVDAAEVQETVEPEPSTPIAASELIAASLAAAESEPAGPEPISPVAAKAAHDAPPVPAASTAADPTPAPTAAPTPAPSEGDSLFPAHLEPAYSVEPEPLFPSHLEPAFTIESESLFPAQPAGWPASASPATPSVPATTPPDLAPAAAAASTPSVAEPVVAAASAAEPVAAAASDVAAASPEVAERTVAAAASPDVPGPSPNATDDLAASAASNTTVLLRRFRASRPAAGVAAVAATRPTQPAQPTTPTAPVAEPLAAAAVAQVVEPAVAPTPIAAPSVQPAAPAAPEPATSPARPNVDHVETPVWRMVAPEGTVAAPPSTAPATAAPKTNGHDRAAEPPQWPAAPQWPASPPRAAAVSGADAIWAQSSRDVLNRPESGVQACLNCGLPLSSTARFCRRCGTSQVSA